MQREIQSSAEALPGANVFHKPGYARGWMSDVVWLSHPNGRRAWIVALAARAGRRGLDDAARHLGALVAEGALLAGPENRSADGQDRFAAVAPHAFRPFGGVGTSGASSPVTTTR